MKLRRMLRRKLLFWAAVAASTSSSGASQQVMLSHTRLMPASSQSFSQLRIHSPSPQP